MGCALAGVLGLHPPDPPAQAPHGVGCLQRPSHEHKRPAPRLRVRSFPAISDPAGNTTSADFSTASNALTSAAVPHHPANRQRTGHLGHPRRPPRVRPATFIAHPPRLRNGPLMASGFASWCRLARTAPPSTRSETRPRTIPTRHVFLGSRLRTPASSPPSLTTEQLPSACGWCHQPPQGTRTPELLVMASPLTGHHRLASLGPPNAGAQTDLSSSVFGCATTPIPLRRRVPWGCNSRLFTPSPWPSPSLKGLGSLSFLPNGKGMLRGACRLTELARTACLLDPKGPLS